MTNSFYTPSELDKLGFKAIGENVSISRFARFYGVENISIGNHVRIDDFCVLTGDITLGNYIHISAHSSLYGKFGIVMQDYTGLSPRCTVFSASDDFGGDYLISPMVPEEYTHIIGGEVKINKYVQIGAGSIVLPAVTINEGVAVGAMSLVKSDLEAWNIYAGNPLKLIKPRQKGLLSLVRDFEKNL